MSDLNAFRSETRDWLEANCPESMRTPMSQGDVVWGGRKVEFKNPDQKVWMDRMGERGWTCPTWPKEYGGGGLNFEENKVLQEELMRIKARPALNSFGIWMLGPALLEYGTEEQKLKHIPKIVKGEIRWCQGYSEPGSGSDLASLKTKAEDQGEQYLINGQKVWTSYADECDMIFTLVRTGPLEPKHEGISFLLIDMDQEGVTTKPIKLISGKSPFCETFFDNATAPKENLVGGLNKGWSVAKRLLQFERNMIAGMGFGSAASKSSKKSDAKPTSGLATMAKRYVGEKEDKLDDSGLRNKIIDHDMNSQAFALTLRRAAEESKKSNQGPSAASSIFKYYGTENNKLRYEIMLEAMGTKALGWDGAEFGPEELAITREWLRTKANSIEGGTSEVQLNVISKRVLELPQ
jgi:alkylation response protein AidB-like acyl-CoA dehydrogenase